MKKLLFALLLPMMAWADDAADTIMREQIELLRGICTKEQADEAAQQVNDFTEPETAQEQLYDALQKEYEKLSKAYYYGSEKMALAMGADAKDAILPALLTPEIQAELEERIRRSFALLPPTTKAKVSGGPGLTRETAWVYTAAYRFYKGDTGEQDARFYDFKPPHLIGGGYPSCLAPQKVQQDGKTYEVYSIAIFHLGKKYELDLWMDVTAARPYADNKEYEAAQPTWEEKQAAAVACKEQRAAILNTVIDRSSADKAAEYLNDTYSTCHEHTDDFLFYGIPEPNALDTLFERYFYGSEALAESCHYDKLNAYEPQALTPRVTAELEQHIRTRMQQAATPLFAKVSGGPGFTKETAWQIPAEMMVDDLCADMSEDTNYEKLWRILTLRESDTDYEELGRGTIGGRYYEAWMVRWLHNGTLYRFNVWLDLSDGRLIPTPAEYHATQAACTQYLQETAAILHTVHDHATADAAAARLKELHEPTDTSSLQPFRAKQDAAPVGDEQQRLREDIRSTKEQLCNAAYYGSDELAALLWAPKVCPPSALTENARKIRNAREAQEDLDYVRVLEQELPRITDRATAMAAARKLKASQKSKVYSHIILLKYLDEPGMDTLPIRRHLRRIRKARYYGSVDLADIFKERLGPSASGADTPETDDDLEAPCICVRYKIHAGNDSATAATCMKILLNRLHAAGINFRNVVYEQDNILLYLPIDELPYAVDPAQLRTFLNTLPQKNELQLLKVHPLSPSASNSPPPVPRKCNN